jgi:vancomycin resistance protein YoaR
MERKPTISDETARQFASSVNQKTANGLRVTAGQRVAQIPASTVRAWLGGKVAANGFDLTLDGAKALVDLRAAMPAAVQKRNAAITLVNNQVQILPSQTGSTCCAPDTPARLLKAVQQGKGDVSVSLQEDKPEFSTADAQKLGIKEPVGTITEWKGQPQVKSFTTYHACCEARVINIHHIADAVRGTIVKPGETFSLNGRVGQRTTAKGYVEAGVIYNGVHDTDIGGGVSQFSTTLFNAAFFAGMDFVAYQSHTIHFDRYPYGREATLGWENPDQKWKNNTPYGVMIWTSYTDTSVTVTLWSTQNVYGQQTAQTSTKVGPCTRVRTERTRTWADGHKSVDHVGSTYRPAEGVDCPGL